MEKTLKELPPIRETPSDFDALEEIIREHFRTEMYLPLVAEFTKTNIIRNALDDLLTAIGTSQISFYRGKFTGRFNSKTSKALRSLGAKWKDGAYHIPLSELPREVNEAISASTGKFERVLHQIDKRLAEMNPAEIADKIRLEAAFEKTLWKTDKKLEQSLKDISIAPKLTEDQAKKISAEYTESLKLPIKDWVAKEVVELRQTVGSHVFSGERYEALAKIIQTSYDVSKRKARFLARQETSLLMTKFKETRYTAAGIHEYKWRSVVGSPLHPVRPMHKELDRLSREKGKIFRWDNPPITDPDGRRNNPGQDYNCRCVAIPVVKF